MSKQLPARPEPNPESHRPGTFAIVASEYNPEFVDGLISATCGELKALLPGSTVELYRVPGAFEIPVVLQEIARGGKVDALIALGVIIQGDTAHAELVGRSVTEALQGIALRHRIPVIHEVLLVSTAEQARTRTLGQEINRGIEAARATVRVCETFYRIRPEAEPDAI